MVNYPGRDLESMSFAVNYHKWILNEFRPFLGKRIVEVGAGSGSFSELLLDESPEMLALVVPSEMFSALRMNPILKLNKQVSYFNSMFEQCAAQVASSLRPDSIVYVNVLEHIENDDAELKLVYSALPRGGRCFIFVPALKQLFGAFDKKIGHYRRYTKRLLEDQCQKAGFNVLRSKYVDALGVIPWFVKYKLFRSDSLEPRAVELYDKVAVPVVKRIEPIFPPPIGKNILLIAEK
jgi:SAM-dependent methyltransferase